MPAFLLVFFFITLQLRSGLCQCPLNFTVLDSLQYFEERVKSSKNVTFQCTGFAQALKYVLVEYVVQSGFFSVPTNSADACWTAFDEKMGSPGEPMDARSQCNWTTLSLAREGSQNCMNITSVKNMTQVLPVSVSSNIKKQCENASAERYSLCSACTTVVVQSSTQYLYGGSNGSINTCQDILSLYAAALAPNGSNDDVATCLFNIAYFGSDVEHSHMEYIYGGVGAAVALLVGSGLVIFIYLKRQRHKKAKQKLEEEISKKKISEHNFNLTWFSIDAIRAATNNFSRINIVGTGGFGNVYKGVLEDGSEIAVKRFKNFSPAGDDEFFHEVEVISSVRHRNLVAVKGCCVDKSDITAHQRIIVYEYMPNGSLHDHLFAKKTKMDWPRRQNIALGIVRGLAYLHQEVQPVIIHRDIKASNILLDSEWNARVADFGLAKFAPDGVTHITTRVAGTQGYVAPEYVLYGQLTEKSDVYSLGIVLLELMTGKKILMPVEDSEGSMLVTDWAWSLVKQGRMMDVLDPNMENMTTPDVVERLVLLSLLCAHPQVPVRPTMDQVRKIMEDDLPLPVIPDRPLAYTAGISEIQYVIGGSGGCSSGSGFQSFSSHGSYIKVA